MVNSLDQKSSVKNKVLILLFTILTVFVVIVTSLYFLKFERDAIEHTAMNYEKIFINGLKKEINSKLSISTMIGLGISQNQKVINALKKEDYIALRKEIDTIQNSIKNNSDYSGVKFQLITKDIKTAFRTWRDKKGDDLRSVGIVAHAFESKKLVTAEAVGKSGYFIRTVAPIFDKNRNIVGAVSVHLGLGSVYRAYKKENMYYGLLLDRNVVGRNFKPSDIVINDNYVTAHKKWFGNDFNNLAKSIDFKEMKELGYMLTDKYFISPMVAKDSKGRVIGKHLIGMDRSTFNEEVNTFENSILIVIALFTFIFLITMSIIYIFVNKSVITPLKEIQGGLNQFFRFINREERDTSYINISNNDEFGNMAGVINSNIDKTRKMIELDNELIKDAKIIINKVQNGWFSDYIEKSTTNHLLEEFKNDVNQMIKDIKQHFLDMNVILKEYSNYDYRRKLELNGIEKGGVLDTLLNNINILRDSITDMLVNNKSNGLTLDNSSSILLKNVDELNKNSNETAASLEETAAALEEMTSNISHNTENIVKMSGYASTLTNSAKKGQDLANQTTTSMDEINGQVSSINEAITIIDQIAFQTNILSLNAAVEAATAGETGKGFAVVAQEVRSLASRSAEAASEIKKLVGNATDKANHGKTIADEMIIGYNDLNKNILETIELISDIENISKEQLTGIEQINGAINSLDRQTQQNASIATQTHSVAMQTDSIAKLVVKNADEKEFEGKENIRGKEMDNFTNNNSNSSFEVRKSTKKATTYSSNSNNEWENF